MKTTIIILAALLTACASEPRSASGQRAPESVAMECDYEATKAAAGIRAPLEQGFQEAVIRRKCLAMKGYK